MNSYDPIRLEVFKHRFAGIAEEMGVVLRKSSYSPNIKERRDYSCALFDAQGNMISQAAHIPVHLGSMPLSVAAAIDMYTTNGKPASTRLKPGDMIVLNDPFQGGTHLPDITLISPEFINLKSEQGPLLFGFVANRAHHADVGGMTPGSMPVAREIFQEGLIIPPIMLFRSGQINQSALDLILANVRTPEERYGDLWAQIAANKRGVQRLGDMVAEFGENDVSKYMGELIAYTERMTRSLLKKIPNGVYSYTDWLDDDGIGDQPVPIKVTITIEDDTARIDFTGSAQQQKGSVNAVYAITLSAVFYVFRCLLGLDVPNNSGCLRPIKVYAPEGSIVNARHPAPVAGGNVETSQRIVDVLLGAISQIPGDMDDFVIPAASQGTMNNITIGGFDSRNKRPFAYYETIGGGMGAAPHHPGLSAIHSHMTNTLNTPIEALEYAYPLQILCYQIRHGSGGLGEYPGGEGIRRDILVLVESQATLLTERRKTTPYGLAGGSPGTCGKNVLIRDNKEHELPGKGTIDLRPGDILSIRTPGGGGYGRSED
jgi:N-methylhydantoinase B